GLRDCVWSRCLGDFYMRQALFGVGAHGAGTIRAYEFGGEEGSAAGLLMVLTGLFNLLVAPLVAHCL
ncbi:LrgB family protein, partial [Pseudomonas aeruginosa]|uniref:LrgB family protein n=1 Tax=Pseudomonas aeruginosa TaxID=287 RepID=UPI001C67D4BC